MNDNIPALIAEARAIVNWGWFRAGYPSLASVITRLADALESVRETGHRIYADALAQAEGVRAELRQERERADEAEANLALAGGTVSEMLSDLSRAEETIEKVQGYADRKGTFGFSELHNILAEYDKQKGRPNDH